MIQRPTLPDLELVERHFQRLLSKIAMTPESSEGGDPSGHWRLNVKGLLFDLSLEITTEFLLGEPPADGSLDGRKPEASVWTDDFANEFNTAFRWISKRERLKGFYWMIDSKEFRSSCKSARRIVDEIVHRSMKAVKLKHKSTESYIAMEPLLRDELEVSMIRDQFLNLLLAGRDTSGSLLCWLFYSLSREPELFTSLKTEMTELLGRNHTRKPTKSDLNRMKRLDQFISESMSHTFSLTYMQDILTSTTLIALRVFPPVPIDCRFSVQTTTLPHGGGDDGESPILIPKGTLIAFSTFATHHSRKLYGDDADRFRIDRWVDDSVKERRMIDWSYHPFIGGPRKCLGGELAVYQNRSAVSRSPSLIIFLHRIERFALIQAKYLTCRILQHFDEMVATDCNGRTLQCGPGGSWVDDVKYHVGLTMSPDEGVWLRLRSAM